MLIITNRLHPRARGQYWFALATITLVALGCSGGGAATECASEIECDDGNPCTQDLCEDGQCQNPSWPDAKPCDDENPCTLDDACYLGACSGRAKDCSDLDGVCVAGICDSLTGDCEALPASDSSPCDDGLYCTVGDMCQGGMCVGGWGRDCDDAEPCTRDECNENERDCAHIWETKLNAEGPANDPTCNDGVDNDCDHLVDGDDPDCRLCTTNEDCDDGNSCTQNTCEGTGCVTSVTNDGVSCEDGSYCTEGDVCVTGVCQGSLRVCDDGDPCTEDTCDEELDQCIFEAREIPGAEGPAGDSTCTNGVDDDCDGLTDGADEDCVSTCLDWTSRDIGPVSIAGNFNCSDGVFTLTGSGEDIWGTSDEFRYAYIPLSGDGWISARVNSLAANNPWAKAGAMIREELTGESRHAHLLVSKDAGNPVKFDRRTDPGGGTTGYQGPLVTAPYWVKLVRRGHDFLGYESADGQIWTFLGTHTVSMADDVFIGLSLTSHDNALTATAVFDHVEINLENAPECITAVECDDGDSGTVDTCDLGVCEHVVLPPECVTDADCDDGDPGTIDTCDLSICNHTYNGPLPVFPGAEGFGTLTPAGRGGQIIKVTNLSDSDSGSLRAAINTSGPRIIVFEVGGVINLSSDLRISSGYCTIAGQTAPFPGIMLKGYGVRITDSNVLLQHLAIRVGDDGRTANGSWDNADALQIIGTGPTNIVIDHCSLSWGIDENTSVWAQSASDITFSNNIIAEGLMYSAHTEQPHSKGLLVGGGGPNPKNVAILGNLFSHNYDRNPQLKGGTSTVISNNVIYNTGVGYGSNLTRNYVDERHLASFIGNVYKDGVDTPPTTYAIASNSTLTPDSEIYSLDNVNLSRPSFVLNSSAISFQVSSPPISIPNFSPLSSDQVMDSVLTWAGSRPAERDDADTRIVNEVVNGTGSLKNHSIGLWPSYPATTRDFEQFIPTSPNGDDDGDGYTNIEEVLHEMAAQVEGR